MKYARQTNDNPFLMSYHIKMLFSREKSLNSKKGAFAEKLAASFLSKRGFRILETNFKIRGAEIDIIASKEGTTHFVEVKSGISREKEAQDSEYRPEELVTAHKIKKISMAAEFYLFSREILGPAQIDVVRVIIDNVTKTARCTYIPHAEA